MQDIILVAEKKESYMNQRISVLLLLFMCVCSDSGSQHEFLSELRDVCKRENAPITFTFHAGTFGNYIEASCTMPEGKDDREAN